MQYFSFIQIAKIQDKSLVFELLTKKFKEILALVSGTLKRT